VVESVPAISNPLWSIIFPYYIREDLIRGHFNPNARSREGAFTAIYGENGWGSTESRSGHGSTCTNTGPIRKSLERLLLKMRVREFLDAPCGDFNWMKHVRLPDDTHYMGGDIVPPLIEQLQRDHGGRKYSFAQIDIARDPLPKADLWLCRDVLIHLSNDDAHAIFRNFVRSDIKFILTTTHFFPESNFDINAGGFRFINLLLPPFDLPAPIKIFYDFVAPEPPRFMGLWSREQVRSAIK
jgi:hypothetical protein